MKQFILKIVAFALLILMSILGVFCLADGSTDAMYLRFTTPQQKSLIIGTSRAAQGIQPQEVKRILNREDLYNFSFQGPSSPYGEIYLESIKRKLDTTTKNGLFILDVNPWTISEVIDQEGQIFYSEKNNFLDNTHFVTMKPNLEYLIESYDDKYAHIIRNKSRKGDYQTFFIENDGWLNVTIESDMISTEARTANKIIKYSKKLDSYKGMSIFRKDALIDIINFLNAHGDVYLVRIPVISEMLAVENELMPNFNMMMQELSEAYNAPYVNMMSDRDSYSFTDGNHLDKTSSTQFSKDLANKIKILQNDK